MHCADRPRSRACAPGERSPHHRQDECVARQEHYSGAVSGVAGGSANRFDRARHLRAASGSARGERQHSGAEHRGPVPRAQPHLLFRERRAKKKSTWAAPTGCRAIFTSAWKCWCRCATRCCANRVRHEILDAYLADNRKARVLLRDATYIRAWQPLHGTRNRSPPMGAAAFSSQDFLIGVAEGKRRRCCPRRFPRASEEW